MFNRFSYAAFHLSLILSFLSILLSLDRFDLFHWKRHPNVGDEMLLIAATNQLLTTMCHSCLLCSNMNGLSISGTIPTEVGMMEQLQQL
jgi:hypothetical protein